MQFLDSPLYANADASTIFLGLSYVDFLIIGLKQFQVQVLHMFRCNMIYRTYSIMVADTKIV